MYWTGTTVPVVPESVAQGDRWFNQHVVYTHSDVGMKMLEGPWFFESFAGGWRFAPVAGGGGTRATWRYNFRCRPRWLAPIVEWIGARVLRRDIDRRIAGFARGCTDPVVLAAVRD